MTAAADHDGSASQPKGSWIAPAAAALQTKEDRLREPVGTYLPSTEAIREWFRRAYGREPSDLEVGELERKLALRQEADPAKPDGQAPGN